jgi:hypothetical protein
MLFIQPAPPHHDLIVHHGNVGGRAAKGREA